MKPTAKSLLQRALDHLTEEERVWLRNRLAESIIRSNRKYGTEEERLAARRRTFRESQRKRRAAAKEAAEAVLVTMTGEGSTGRGIDAAGQGGPL